MNKTCTAMLLMALAGCATTVSEVTPLGGGLYMVGANARLGTQSDGEIMAAAVQKATAYCIGIGKSVEVTATQATGVQGLTPRNADVRFSCN